MTGEVYDSLITTGFFVYFFAFYGCTCIRTMYVFLSGSLTGIGWTTVWDSRVGKFDLGYWLSPNVITNTLGG